MRRPAAAQSPQVVVYDGEAYVLTGLGNSNSTSTVTLIVIAIVIAIVRVIVIVTVPVDREINGAGWRWCVSGRAAAAGEGRDAKGEKVR